MQAVVGYWIYLMSIILTGSGFVALLFDGGGYNYFLGRVYIVCLYCSGLVFLLFLFCSGYLVSNGFFVEYLSYFEFTFFLCGRG